MPTLRLAHTNKAIREYYASLRRQPPQHVTHDSPITVAFAALLEACAEQFHWTLMQQYELQRKPHRLCVDGALVDRWALAHGFWEASGERDDLAIEARKKIDQGCPTSNTLFQAPQRILLYRDGQPLLDESIVEPQALVQVLKEYFGYRPDAYEQWERAADEFKDRFPQFAQALLNDIDKERHASSAFRPAFSRLVEACRQSLGPSLSEAAVEKMLAQHILAEGIFRTMFDDPDFARANPFAQEFEQAAAVLAQVGWSQDRVLSELDRFLEAIRSISFAVEDFAVKQQFLASIYEAFFQGFDARTPTPYAIVHTPPPIIRFMVRSVDALLHEHLGHSLSDPDVHVLDPFAGTGSFIVDVLSQIARSQITAKYESALHANEILLLPYYIASMNIEHEYAEITGDRRPFLGLCLADTFELAEA
ncbi:MAG TPA: N-6 DNA methylase, partial [Gemmatimonadaceae bacterium]|nr:N-6 DNA methylase [Gemmatimonadaceae bacterium]